MNDFLTDYIFRVKTEMNENTEQVIREFLLKEGYELGECTRANIEALQTILGRQGKRLRVEIFYKFTGDYNMQYLVLPFFEPLDYNTERIHIYNAMNLAEKGYIL